MLGIGLVLQRNGVTSTCVYIQLLCRHYSKPLEPVDPVAWVWGRETVHIYRGTQTQARVWTHFKTKIF
jgi:hypothetical protein